MDRDFRTTDISTEFAGTVGPAWRDLLVILVVSWAAVVLAEAIEGLVLPFIGGWWFISLSLIPLAFATGMVAHRLLWDWHPTLGECAHIAARAFLSLLAILALTRVAASIGLVLLVLPGFAVIVLSVLAPVILMAERRPIVACFVESARSLLPSIVKILGAYIVFLVVFVGCAVVVLVGGAIVTVFIADEGVSDLVLDAGVSALASVLHTSFGVAIYKALSRFGETDGSPVHE